MQEVVLYLALFLAGSVYWLAQYYFTGGIPFLLPESNQVISFVRDSTGFLAMGTVSSIIMFVLALRVISHNRNELLLIDERASEGPKVFQTVREKDKVETPDKVVPLPLKKKALKKIYGKSKEQEESKKDPEKFRKKIDFYHGRRVYYGDYYNSSQRGNVVMFRQKLLPYQRRAYRSKIPGVAAASNRVKWGTKLKTANQSL